MTSLKIADASSAAAGRPVLSITNAHAPDVRWLDAVHARLLSEENVEPPLVALNEGLRERRKLWQPKRWKQFCAGPALAHPLSALLHQCPFTSHGYSRPRGYPGDAELLDYLYADEACPQDRLGSAIYRFIHRLPSAMSVRERRELLAKELDVVAMRVEKPRVLSVAAGHLRECEHSQAVREGGIGQLIALDQDASSLALIARDYPYPGVTPMHGSIRKLISGQLTFENLDFAYSAGLYDYLSAATARRLTRRLVEMLKPGGHLLLANFAMYPPEVGYIEAFMDWWLIYRSAEQVRDFAAEVPREMIHSMELYGDMSGNVLYLDITRSKHSPPRSQRQ